MQFFDPGFDATAAKTSAVRAHEVAIIDIVLRLALPDHTAAAVNRTVQAGTEATPVSSGDLSERREQLRKGLAGCGAPAPAPTGSYWVSLSTT